MATYFHGLAYLAQIVNTYSVGSNLLDFDRARMLAHNKVGREKADLLDNWIMKSDACDLTRAVIAWRVRGALPTWADAETSALFNSVVEVFFHYVNSSKLQPA
jgi:hypothetical protein